MRIVIRTDASIQIGTGHVMRCLALAEELQRQGHQCLFICRDHEGHLGELIITRGFELILLCKPSKEMFYSKKDKLSHSEWLGVSWQTDAEQSLKVLAKFKSDWLVVDHYALDERWERLVLDYVGQIMVIDDLADRKHVCSILLDQNLGRTSSDYAHLVPKNCKTVIGPKYALLRREFAELREISLKRRQNPELKRILIFLGGIDRTNVTGQVLAALAESALPRDTVFDVVMGAAAPFLDDVRQQVTRLPFIANVSVNVNNMAERMCRADLSIGAAGSTSWERCCMGLPNITVVLADNQRLIADALAESEAALLVDISHISRDIPLLVERFFRSGDEQLLCTQKARVVCDGAGVGRVVSVFTGEMV